ncbi:MAG: AtpZ/AtpI family protein [Acidobacteriaceae bacterium]|nr:AtpZ/AtpI family protein [Acidobacteriaceae bacterium]
MPQKPDRSLLWLGKYLSLALTLPASVVGGYVLGALADHWLHLEILRAVGIILGMAAGLTQILRELSRETKKTDSSQ